MLNKHWRLHSDNNANHKKHLANSGNLSEHYGDSREQKSVGYENLYGKYDGEVSIYVKIAHAAAFKHQCEPQKQFADSGS